MIDASIDIVETEREGPSVFLLKRSSSFDSSLNHVVPVRYYFSMTVQSKMSDIMYDQCSVHSRSSISSHHPLEPQESIKSGEYDSLLIIYHVSFITLSSHSESP